MKRSILFATIVFTVFMSGCSAMDRTAFCRVAAAGGALGGLNPFALPCIANEIIDFRSKLVGSTSEITSPEKLVKTEMEVVAAVDSK